MSQERAKMVKIYLEANGVNPFQLDYKGYGSNKPVADNLTEEGKAQNRIVEFTLKEIKQ
jgi:outer membrane protein OmpA-like peptidoglycan-associated protein